jgi:hypothetical protein
VHAYISSTGQEITVGERSRVRMPPQFSFADFMTVFAILGALGVIPISDTYRAHLAEHIYRYRRIQDYKSKKNPWYRLKEFFPFVMLLLLAYSVQLRKISPVYNGSYTSSSVL